MEKLEILKDNAVKAFDSANSSGKQLLNNLFGEKVFAKKITDRVKSYEDACQVLGVLPIISIGNSPDSKSIEAYAKLCVIIRALNEGWTPDWNNSRQEKWYCWFYMDGAFRLSGVYYYYTSAAVGSRLCFKNAELAKYAAAQFESLYKEFFTL